MSLMLIRLIHLVALALAVGAATAKIFLLVKCRKEPAFTRTFVAVERSITAQIITGQVLLTLTGIAYAVLLGFGVTPRLVVKVALVAIVWVLGPIIDKVVSPALRRTVPAAGEPDTPQFRQALNRYLFWEVTATGIYYAIIVFWVAIA